MHSFVFSPFCSPHYYQCTPYMVLVSLPWSIMNLLVRSNDNCLPTSSDPKSNQRSFVSFWNKFHSNMNRLGLGSGGKKNRTQNSDKRYHRNGSVMRSPHVIFTSLMPVMCMRVPSMSICVCVIKRNGMQSSSVSRTNTSSIGIQYAWRYACIRVFFFAVVFSILPSFVRVFSTRFLLGSNRLVDFT